MAKEVNHYASGLVLVVIGLFGIAGSITGELANMLAALWAPDSLSTESGGKAPQGQGSPSLGSQIVNFFVQPGAALKDVGQTLGKL